MTLALALILDAIFGEPSWLWSRLPHPAVLIGRAIGLADARFNRGGARFWKGLGLVAALVSAAVALGLLLAAIPGQVVDILVAAVLLAHRSLVDHVRAVADALRLSVGEGRRSVAMIVGRDTAAMDGPAVARAAVESAAENFSDGVVAPAFWFALFGLPGILAYKAVNTADSMIGYRTERHEEFGKAAARLDDVLNWIPARLTAALIWLAAGRAGRWDTIAADARLHRSPNAGWPEAAAAPALGIALSGPRSYEGQMRDFPFVNAAGRREAGPADIEAAVGLLWRAWTLGLVTALGLALIGISL